MLIWHLAKIEKVGGVARYHYESELGKACFGAHPSEAFCWVWHLAAPSNAAGKALLKAFMMAGVRQHEFAGGFNEAIKRLEVGK